MDTFIRISACVCVLAFALSGWWVTACIVSCAFASTMACLEEDEE